MVLCELEVYYPEAESAEKVHNEFNNLLDDVDIILTVIEGRTDEYITMFASGEIDVEDTTGRIVAEYGSIITDYIAYTGEKEQVTDLLKIIYETEEPKEHMGFYADPSIAYAIGAESVE